jgi:hypothetical protein
MTTIRSADLRFLREHAWIVLDNKWPIPSEWWHTEKLPHFPIFQHAASFLESKGFRFYTDRKFEKRYKSLVQNYRWAIRRRLRVELHLYPAGFLVQFYQSLWSDQPPIRSERGLRCE